MLTASPATPVYHPPSSLTKCCAPPPPLHRSTPRPPLCLVCLGRPRLSRWSPQVARSTHRMPMMKSRSVRAASGGQGVEGWGGGETMQGSACSMRGRRARGARGEAMQEGTEVRHAEEGRWRCPGRNPQTSYVPRGEQVTHIMPAWPPACPHHKTATAR